MALERVLLVSKAEIEDLDKDIALKRDIIQLNMDYLLQYNAVSVVDSRDINDLGDVSEASSNDSNPFLTQDADFFILTSYGRNLLRATLAGIEGATHVKVVISGAIRPDAEADDFADKSISTTTNCLLYTSPSPRDS